MKLKNIVLASVAAGALIAGSSVFAGLTLVNNTKIPSKNIWVKCNPGLPFAIPGLFNKPVTWSDVSKTFFAGKLASLCTFTDNNTSVELGTGNITITGTTGTVKASATDSHITITPTDITAENVTITLSGSE